MLGKITIGQVWNPIKGAKNVYIGRSSKAPSPLGNPYVISAKLTRDDACNKYEEYLVEQLNQGNKIIRAELNRIGSMVLAGQHVNLLCYCKDKRCHGEFIRDLISERLLEYQAELEEKSNATQT